MERLDKDFTAEEKLQALRKTLDEVLEVGALSDWRLLTARALVIQSTLKIIRSRIFNNSFDDYDPKTDKPTGRKVYEVITKEFLRDFKI